ncbi:hypothetical protein Ciccas_009430 [Cichlidogyrus casuarinus]|uniref:Uncharacterized protein n=1 Tax=Cichlidogyrus casuarinus TaxID=1844966 RepID=A0ABD2PX23_9PLAT
MDTLKELTEPIKTVLATIESQKHKLSLFFVSILLRLVIVHILRRSPRLDRVMKFVLSGFYYHLTGPMAVHILYSSTWNFFNDLFARVLSVLVRFFFYMNVYAQDMNQPYLYLDERFGSFLVSNYLIITSIYDVIRNLYFMRKLIRSMIDWGIQTKTHSLLYIFIVLVIQFYNSSSGTTIIFAACCYLTMMFVYLIQQADPRPQFCSSLSLNDIRFAEIQLTPVNLILRLTRHIASPLPTLRGIETKKQFITVQAISLVFDAISVLSQVYIKDWGHTNIKGNSLDYDLMEGLIIKVILVIVLKMDIYINLIFDYMLPKKVRTYFEVGQTRIKRAIKCLLIFVFTLPPFYYPFNYYKGLMYGPQRFQCIAGSNFLLCFFCKEAGVHHFLVMLSIEFATVLFLRPITEEINAFVSRQSFQISPTLWSSFIIVLAGVLAYCLAMPVLSPCRFGTKFVTYGISFKRALRDSHSSKNSSK